MRTFKHRTDWNESNDSQTIVIDLMDGGTSHTLVTIPQVNQFCMGTFAEYLLGRSGSEVSWPNFGREQLDRLVWLADVIDIDDHDEIVERLDYEPCTEEVQAIAVWFALRWEYAAMQITPAKIHDASELASQCLEWAIKRVESNVASQAK